MYKSGSDRHQTALFRGRLADWAGGAEHISPEDEQASAKSALASIEEELKTDIAGDRRKELGTRKLEIQGRLKELKPLIGRRNRIANDFQRGLEHYFVSAAKGFLPKIQYELIRAMAEREYDADGEAVKKESIPINSGRGE